MDFYGTRREDLLGSMVSTLTDGRVSKVQVSRTAKTGMTSYDIRTGEVQGIVLPLEENLPEGCTMEAARGLMDHESGHALFTTVDPGSVPQGLLLQVTNILEDPRVEQLFMQRYEGSKENIGALTVLGFGIIDRALAEGGHGALDLALLGLSLEAYGQDASAFIGTRPHSDEVLAFLDSARPHVAAALKSKETQGVIAQSKAIVALLKDASAHVPPQPAPMPSKGAQSGDGEGQETDRGGSDNAEGEDASSAPVPGETEDEREEGSPSTGQSKGDQGKESKPRRDRKEDVEADSGAGEPGQESDDAEGEDASSAAAPGEADSGLEQSSREAEGSNRESATEDAGSRAEGEASADPSREPADQTPGAQEHCTDPLSQGGTKPSKLAQEAMDAQEGFDPKRFSPAEAVLDQLKDAIEKERQRIEKEKQEELLKAQRSGLVCPLGTTPGAWKQHEREIHEAVTAGNRRNYPLAVEQLRPVIMGVRHALRIPLMAQGRSRVRTGRDFGDLDPAAVVHVAMGTSDRVFQRVYHGKTSKTAVFLLVDQSGSMNGSKIEAARMAAVALSEALCGLPGLHTEIGGFTHWNGVSVHRIAKTFREQKAEGALALGSGGGNADGSAVRWAARRLLNFQADRRVLIVLSDGWPSDGPLPAEDLRAAVNAAEQHGIETMGIGILDNSVEAYYPKHVVIHHVGELSGAVLRAMAGLFTPEGIARAQAKVRAQCA